MENFFAQFRQHIIGNDQTFASPFGKKEIIYADWTAGGRAYRPIEAFLQKEVLPFVANTHTQTTITGGCMSVAYEEAKSIVKEHVHADSNDALIFCGSGMTGAVNKLQRILGLRVPERMMDYLENAEPLQVKEQLRPVVFITHMEHHSNHLSWLETIATIEITGCDKNGLVDLNDFQRLLKKYKRRKNKIAAVTACSNVTGIRTPYHEIAKMIHAHGGCCFVDFACSAPYVDINMHPHEEGAHLDAIYFSPHKFLGGPGTPGVLIFNKKMYRNNVPDQPGGGAVVYSNPWNVRAYVKDIEQREDAGTPPFLQAIKVAMCVRLKEAMGVENMLKREEEILSIVFKRLSEIKNIEILEGRIKKRLGVISFIVHGAHYNAIVKILNDRFGIQTRGGCSCAGTYGHYLLNVDKARSYKILHAIRSGDLLCKPGWVRLSVHPTMTNAAIDKIMDAIEQTAAHYQQWMQDYTWNAASNEYVCKVVAGAQQITVREWFEVEKW